MEEIYPKQMLWNGIRLVCISDVGQKFSEWLYGQTIPLVEDAENPYDWAYYSDYLHFLNNPKYFD